MYIYTHLHPYIYLSIYYILKPAEITQLINISARMRIDNLMNIGTMQQSDIWIDVCSDLVRIDIFLCAVLLCLCYVIYRLYVTPAP